MVDISKKFNLQGVLDNIKSMVNPTGETPNANADDAIGLKIADLSIKIQELAADTAEQAKKLAKVNKLFNGLYKDIELLRNPPEEESTLNEEASDKKEQGADSENKDTTVQVAGKE